MKKRNKLKLMFFKVIRHIKNPKKYKPFIAKLKVQTTVVPNGDYINPNDIIYAKNKLRGTGNASLSKDKRMCGYNYTSHTCHCGMTLVKMKDGNVCELKNRR